MIKTAFKAALYAAVVFAIILAIRALRQADSVLREQAEAWRRWNDRWGGCKRAK